MVDLVSVTGDSSDGGDSGVCGSSDNVYESVGAE